MAEQTSTRFPFISLAKAIERARQLWEADQGRRGVAVPTAFAAWGYSEKSSGGFQTIAALKLYGLAEDEGSNDDRRIKPTESARRYFLTEVEDQQKTMLPQFALHSPFLKSLWEQWATQVPADNVARTYLKVERGLSDQSARSALGIYKENLAFADIKNSPIIPEAISDGVGNSGRSEIGYAERAKLDPPPPPSDEGRKSIRMQEGERVVFAEEDQPHQYLKLIASGEMNEYLLEALEDYIKRQKRRLVAAKPDILS